MADPQTATDPLPAPTTPPAQAPMHTMEFVNTGRADDAYAQRENDIEWHALLQKRAAEAAAQAGPTPQSTLFPAPSAPSAVRVGVETGARAAGEGVRSLVDGLRALVGVGSSTGTAKALNLPAPQAGEAAVNPMEAIKKVLIDGLMQFGFSPITAGFAGAGQALENLAPEVAGATVVDGFAAAGVRGLLSGTNLATMTPEEQQAATGPLTVRELIEGVLPTLAPFAAGAAVKGAKQLGKAVKKQAPVLLGERGSFGPLGKDAGAGFTPADLKGLKPSMEPGEAVRQAEAELPGASAAQIEARVNELLAVPAQGTAGETPPTPPADAAMRLNLARVSTTEGVKAVMADLNKFNAERLAEHRKTQTHAEVLKDAQGRGGLTLARALAHDLDTVMLDPADAIALSDLFNGAATYYDTLIRRKQGGEVLPPGQLKAAFVVAQQLAALDEAQGRNMARGLAIRKERSDSARVAQRVAPEKILAAANKLGDLTNMSDETLAGMTGHLTGPQRKSWLRQVGMGIMAGKDLLHAAWIQSLLTSPETHAVNLAGTGAAMLFELPERFVAEMVNVVRRDPNGVQIGETAAGLKVMVEAMQNGFRVAGKSWREGQAPFEAGGGKLDIPRLRAENYGFSPETPLAKFYDVMGSALNSKWTPGGALVVEDALAKGAIYTMELSAQALREGKRENLTGADLEKRVRDLEMHPTPEMVANAQDQAVLLTLNKQLGEAGQLFMRWANAIPGGRVVLPFIRWGTNAAKWFGQRAPILSEISAQNWRDIEAGGAAKDKAIARIVVGQAAAMAIAWEVANGTITGSGSAQKGLKPFRECPPYSIKSATACYPNYLRWGGAAGQMIGAIANYAELRRDIPEDQDLINSWVALGEVVGIAAGEVFIDQTSMMGLSKVLDSIKDPDRNAGKFLQSLARSAVPSGVRRITRMSDDNVVREVHSVLDAFKSGLPLYAQDIPVVRNQVTGEAIHYPTGVGIDMVSPIFFSKKQDSPVFKELVKNRTVLTPVPNHIGGDMPKDEGPQVKEAPGAPGVKLTAWERDFWIIAMTEQVRVEGRTLYQAFEHLMRPGSSYWNQSTGMRGGQQVQIRAIYKHFMDKGEQLLRDPIIGSPNLEAAIRHQQEAQIEQKLPITNPRSPQNPVNERPPNRGAGITGLIQSLGR
jgi:hypothetical protein